ncbi:MAG: alpha/beta fold hydrolase [Prolixibacteraceae bacterium]|nr:alpha/beta fold hydrolase [Prolixibacteraceae bacterium]MBN2650147.1 alpha/beta fold hydrolase [Prolixibacteraceae bacterium]
MRTKIIGLLILIAGFFSSCSNNEIEISPNAHDLFSVRSNGNDMLVKVVGNTESKVIILFVHGGPGEGSWIFEKNIDQLTSQYAVALWDQANSGSSQGNNSGDFTIERSLNDMEKVVKALKTRYDDGFGFYLMGHSCGGGFSVAYLAEGENQNDFKGFINVDGAHKLKSVKDFQLIELEKRANIEVNKGNTDPIWQEALDFCENHSEIKTIDEFSELSLLCGDATAKIDSVNLFTLIDPSTFFGEYSFFSYLSNWSSLWAKEDYLKQIFWETDYSDKLPEITIPSLAIWGAFDINCSVELMGEAYHNQVGSADKSFVLCEHSGHYPFVTEPDFFTNEVVSFIKNTK